MHIGIDVGGTKTESIIIDENGKEIERVRKDREDKSSLTDKHLSEGGTILSNSFNIKENNWLGEGKAVAFDIAVASESLTGSLSYNDPNYNFLGNSLNYSFSSTENDKPNQGYENSIITARVGTTFEQFKDVTAVLGLTASIDDLRTLDLSLIHI